MANIKISELNPLLTVQDADVLPIVDNAITKKVTAAILRSYTEGNSVLLTGAQTVAGIKTFTSQLASSVATGTAPFSVASTTKVTNLNADLLDGLSSADFQATLSGTGIVKSTAGTISYLTDNSTNWNTAFNDKINSAAVTGSGTNTLTLTQQDAGTITATWVNGTLIREIRNNTGATLTKGTIVYISGATGNKPTVSKALATGDSTSAQTFGFVQEDILNNANGYVVVIGDLTGVDTSAFTEGDQLYLSSTIAGTFTSTKQYAPAHLVYVGIVTRSHPTLGQIEVNIQNGYELDELHNVAAQSPSNGDILQYVTSTGLWTKIGGTTSAISEGSNLYFTNARSRSAISLTTTGTSGAATYNSTTGVLNVPNYADTDTGITSLNGLTALTQTFAVGTSGTDFGISSATSTHTFNLPTASATNRGALSSADWTTFNNKQNALTNPITGTGTTNYLPKFTGASALGNSLLSDNGTVVTSSGKLTVDNNSGISILASANFGMNMYFDGATGYSYIDSKYDSAGSGRLYIRTRTNGTPVNALMFLGTGDATFVADATINGIKVGEGGGSIATNTAVGASALNANTTGDYNTALGSSALVSNISGANNTALGASALFGNVTGSANTAIGLNALRTNTASNNTAVGFEAAYTNASGTNITAIGYRALKASTGANNTAVGFSTLLVNSTGTNNTAIGDRALTANTTGITNTAIGQAALFTNIVGNNNTAIGTSALFTSTGSGNTAIGSSALLNNTASNNVAIGFEAALTNTTAIRTTAIGYQALRANTTGSGNTAIGQESLKANTTGAGNTAVGSLSLFQNTTGTGNTGIGGFDGTVNPALYANTTGIKNTSIGSGSMAANITGSNNSVLGYNQNCTDFSSVSMIGVSDTATASNQMRFGSSVVVNGVVATEVNASSKVWNVFINGVAQKILLA